MIKLPTKPRAKAVKQIGPADHGRRMTLDAFDRAAGREGHLYELNKGVVEVVDVPQPRHLAQVQEIRRQLARHQDERPHSIHTIAGSHEAKLLIGPSESERHPDLCVYISPPPDVQDVWSMWVPAIVIEVVSLSSSKRDYEEKPSDYLLFGVDEYWIVDATRKEMTAMTRWRGEWKVQALKPSRRYTTRVLPGFSLDLKRVFDAAK